MSPWMRGQAGTDRSQLSLAWLHAWLGLVLPGLAEGHRLEALGLLGIAGGMAWNHYHWRSPKLLLGLLWLATALMNLQFTFTPLSALWSCLPLTYTLLHYGTGPALLGAVGNSLLLFVMAPLCRPDGCLRQPEELANWVAVGFLFFIVALVLQQEMKRLLQATRRSLLEAHQHWEQAEQRLQLARQHLSQRGAAQIALLESQRLQAQGQLLSGLASVIDEALSTVRGALGDLLRGQPTLAPPQGAAVAARIMAHSAGRIQELLRRFLAQQRPPHSHDLGEGVELAALAQSRASAFAQVTGAAIEVTGESNLWVALPPGVLAPILDDLLGNAWEAAPGQPIRVRIDAPSNGARLRVLDRGPGLSPEAKARAGEFFFTTKDPQHHFGLGLALGRWRLESLGGQLRCSNREPGPGLTAELWLPRQGLNPEPFGGAEAPLSAPPESWEKPPSEEAFRSWQASLVTSLARASTAVAASFILLDLLTGLPVPWAYLGLTGLLAWSGWGRLPQSERSWLMFSALGLACLLHLAKLSYLASSSSVILLILVALATFLGPPKAGEVTLGLVAISFVSTGYLFANGSLKVDPALVDVSSAANFVRKALKLGLCQVLLCLVFTAFEARYRSARRLWESAQAEFDLALLKEQTEARQLLFLQSQSKRLAGAESLGRTVETVALQLAESLQGLTLNASLLSQGQEASETLLVGLQRSCDQAQSLAGQLLSPEGPGDFLPAPIDLCGELGTALGLMVSLLRGDLTLVSEFAPRCWVRLASSDLKVLLYAIIDEANAQLPEEASLQLQLSRNQEQVQLKLSFWSASPAAQAALESLVRYSQGQVTDSSTQLEVRWPLAQQGLRLPPPASPSGRGHILLAEEDPGVRLLLARQLRGAGYQVQEASQAREAMDCIGQGRPWSALVLDGGLPGVSPREVIDFFQACQPGRPVILCWGGAAEELTRAGLALERLSLMPKPFEPSTLLERLTQLLTSGSGRRKLAVLSQEAALRQSLQVCLQGAGYEVVGSSQAEELLTQCRQHPPDLLLLDLRLGDPSGLQVSQQLNQRWPQMGCLFMTSERSWQQELGPNVLMKPFSQGDILALVQQRLMQPGPPLAG